MIWPSESDGLEAWHALQEVHWREFMLHNADAASELPVPCPEHELRVDTRNAGMCDYCDHLLAA